MNSQKKVTFRIILLFFLLVYFILFSNRVKNDFEGYFYWASMNYFLFCFPILFYFVQKKDKISSFPFIGLLGISLLVSFGIPPFLIETNSYQLYPLTVECLQISFWAYLIFFLFFYLFKSLFQSVTPFNPIKQINYGKLRIFAVLNAIIYLLSISFFYSLNHLGDFSLYIFLGLNIVHFGRRIKLLFIEKLLFYAILCYELIIRITSGLAAPVVMFFLFLLIIDFLVNRSYSRLIFPVLTLVVLYSLFSFVKFDFRKAVWETDNKVNTVSKIGILSELTFDQNNIENITNNEEKNDKDNFFWRFSYQASALSLVINQTPHIVPYWEGSTYKVFSKFIPRFIWKDKPSEDLGQEFGHAYGVLDFNDNGTSMNTPILTEAYMNYGLNGTYFIMFLFAFLYAYLDVKFNSFHFIEVNSVLGIALLFPLIIHESNFSLVFGNIPLKLISISILIKIFNIGKK